MSGSHDTSPQTRWVYGGSITSEEAALGVDERDVATAEALTSTKYVLITPVAEPKGMLLRFRSDGDENVDSVLHLYASRGDYYHRIAQLTITQGTQDTSTSTIHFVDTITPASEDALFDGEESDLADMIAHYYFRTLGFSRFLILASDLDSTTVYVDYAPLYE